MKPPKPVRWIGRLPLKVKNGSGVYDERDREKYGFERFIYSTIALDYHAWHMEQNQVSGIHPELNTLIAKWLAEDSVDLIYRAPITELTK